MAPIATLTVRLSAQIAEFQSEFKQAAKSAETFQDSFEGVATKASAFGNIIAAGVLSAVGSFGSFAHSILENAGHIADLASKTGLTTTAIQQMSHVAEQTGTTLDAFTTAAFKLGANLAGGNKSVSGAVASLGLSFQALQRMKPDEQFNLIAAALGKMENPQERNRLGLLLFGKTFKDIAPSISEGYAQMAADATVSSEDQIKALDAAGDAWARFKKDATTHATAFAGSVILAGQAIAHAGWSETFKEIAANAGSLNFALSGLIDKMNEASKIKGKDINLPNETGFKPPTDFLKAIADARKELDQLTKSDRLQIAAAKDMGIEQSEIASQFGISEVALRLLTAQMREHHKEVKKAIPVTSEMAQVLSLVEKAHAHQAETLAFETVAWQAWESTVSNALSHLASNPVLLQGRNLSGFVQQVGEAVTHVPAPVMPPSFFDQMFDPKAIGAALGNSITAAIQGGGNIFAAAAGTLGQVFTSNLAKYLTDAKELGGKAIGGFLGGAIQAVLPGIGALMGPIVSKIADALGFGSAGRDVVKDFAAQFRTFNLDTLSFNGGGFDELHAKLLEIGAEGERLWIALTQGVGKNNPEQARAVIDLITAALAKQKGTLDETATSATAAADAQTAASQKALDAIKEMDEQMASLQQSIAGEAPEEFMGIVEANTRAQIDAIAKQRAAAQAALDDTTTAAAAAAAEAGDIIDLALEKREFRIKVKVDFDGLPPGTVSVGPTPFEPSPSGASSGSRPVVIQNHIDLNGRELVEGFVNVVHSQGAA